ncbi:hypothetical protein D5085_17910 [Ectothiorhodospiraceae bacterium BW-2]|nr:hypothetical protein D5085_17910 [Ectothiorhodospiraceae bacterium BW-2]
MDSLWILGVWLLVAIALFTLLLAVGLMLWPQRMVWLQRNVWSWFWSQQLLEPIDRPRYIDAWFYRRHEAVGAVVALFAAAVLYLLAFYAKGELEAEDLRYNPHWLPFWQWLYGALLLLLWGSHLFALIIGLMVYWRPSLLKQLELRANRWISSRELLQPLSRFEQKLLQQSRWLGGGLLLGSLWLLYLLLLLLP